MTIGEIINQYLIENHMSQREFAAKCGNITHVYVNMLVRGTNPSSGKPATPTVEKLQGLAKGLDCTFDELLERADEFDVDLRPYPSNKKHDLTDDEEEVLRLYRSLNDKNKLRAAAYLEGVSDTQGISASAEESASYNQK